MGDEHFLLEVFKIQTVCIIHRYNLSVISRAVSDTFTDTYGFFTVTELNVAAI